MHQINDLSNRKLNDDVIINAFQIQQMHSYMLVILTLPLD